MIWKRFAASRMSAARNETTSVKICAGEYTFTVAASKVAFDGFMSVYTQEEDNKKDNVLSQSLEKGMKLSLLELKPEQHFTQPPAHYTEASLVKALEEKGIGRPSTYAPTITTIISRRYVAKEQKNLYVTELGEVVNNIMKTAFPSIVDVNFTAMMEGLLDCVEAGHSPVENGCPQFLSGSEKRCGRGGERTGEGGYPGRSDRCDLRILRKKHGDQIWTPWKIPRMSGIPGVQEYQALLRKDRCALS